MNNSWKLSILGAVALAASTAVMAIGCTVTTTNATDDGGTGGDASTADGGTSDSATADSGGDTGASCTATAMCPIIASSSGVTFDSCGTCDKCAATSCCAQITACFAKDDAGADSDCSQLFDCLVACENNDAGLDPTTCKEACRGGHSQAAFDLLSASDNCQTTNCNSACGGDLPDANAPD